MFKEILKIKIIFPSRCKEKGSAVCDGQKPNTGRGGAPKFFLDWLTFALKPYDADHIVSKKSSFFDPAWVATHGLAIPPQLTC